jgi:peroxiredoxin
MHRHLLAPLATVLATTVSATAIMAAELSAPSAQDPGTATTGHVNPIASTQLRGFVEIGDLAPEFSYLGTDGDWHKLREILSDGDILLIFGATESVLKDLTAAKSVFEELGVQPVVVLDMSSGSAARYVRRLDLDLEVVSDARCAIGDLYGSLDRSTGRHAPGYFLLDPKRTVRAMHRGVIPPARQLVAAAARGLARPMPASAWMLSKRD